MFLFFFPLIKLLFFLVRIWGVWRRFGGGRKYSGYDAYSGYDQRPEEYQFDGLNFVQSPAVRDSTFTLFLKPVALAVNGPKGMAVANPVSHVIIGSGQKGNVVFNPRASAIVGPGGIAHAQSDLYLYEHNLI